MTWSLVHGESGGLASCDCWKVVEGAPRASNQEHSALFLVIWGGRGDVLIWSDTRRSRDRFQRRPQRKCRSKMIHGKGDKHMLKASNLAKIAAGTILSATLAVMLAGCNDTDSNTASDTANTNATNTKVETSTEDNVVRTVDLSDSYASGIHHAVLTVEGYEPVTIELNADAAPISASNFASLVEDGYYDGKTFYRFQDGFCMQGGTKGNSASGQDGAINQILGEFADNGVDNPLADKFGRGTVAMARSMDPDSASSTFFVTLGSGAAVSASLNGQYAAFGTIDEAGMAVIDQIVADHLAAAEASMGMVNDPDEQATITSIVMVD